MLKDVFIYDHVRTPRGRLRGGALHEVTPVRLASGLFHSLQERTDLDTSQINQVFLGCVTNVGEQGANIARTSVYMSGWGEHIAGTQVNTFCASGLVATNTGAMYVASGQEDVVVTGGVECMSRVPMGSDGGALLMDPEVVLEHKSVPQGIGADLIATIGGFSRGAVDAYALESQKRTAKAWEAGHFNRSIVPVVDDNGLVILDRDEHPRPETTTEALAKLKPSFAGLGEMGCDELVLSRYLEVEHINHVHTAGNASGIVDGACLVLMGNEEAGKRNGWKPRARIVATTLTGTEPGIMLIGPAPATRMCLKKAGMTIDQIDLFEVNEAFASVVMRFMDKTGAPHEKVNVNGGAIAMGHPLGATGAMILGTLVDELERQNKRFGLATLCAAGGMGVATIVERVER